MSEIGFFTKELVSNEKCGMLYQHQRVIDFLRELRVPFMIWGICGVLVWGCNKWQHHIEQENLSGICEGTGTNLYEILGAEHFYNLAQKYWLEEERKRLKEHSEKHWEICSERHCGLYLLSDDAESFVEVLNTYQQRFVATAVPRHIPAETEEDKELVNNPTEILMGMVTKKLDLNKPFASMKEGIYFSQFYQFGYITVISKYKEDDLYTLSQIKDKDLLGWKSYISSTEDRRKGIRNFYIKTREFYLRNETDFISIQRSMIGLSKTIKPITNCGYRETLWPNS